MSFGMSGVSPLVAQPYRRPCVVVPSLESWSYCGRPSGEHTVLDWPLCDDCWEAIREP